MTPKHFQIFGLKFKLHPQSQLSGVLNISLSLIERKREGEREGEEREGKGY